MELAKTIRYIGNVVLLLAAMGVLVGCGRLYTREFVIPESQASPDLNGWTLDIDLEHYHMMPKSQVQVRPKVWIFDFVARHAKPSLGSQMYDLGVDSLRVIMPTVADTIRSSISSEFYFSYSESSKDPILKGYGWDRKQPINRLWIPDVVDTVLVEFFCELRLGVYERHQMSEYPDSDLMDDSVVVDTTSSKPEKRAAMLKMVRHETDVWFPF